MVRRNRLKALFSRLTTNRWRTGSLLGFVAWCSLLRYGDLGMLPTVLSMPFGIALFAMGPLEFLPDRWFWVDSFLSAVTGLFFQGSLMLIWGVLAFELTLSQYARTAFVVLCIVLQVIIIGWIQRRMMRSYIRKRSEQRNRAQ
ncbi:hypothetical protein [Pseudomonas putida]|uniref:hypothetical protein n=1 Tax=Pseudomonas putida TaxID=303 RepID=UPI001F519FD5|nr:hypothetical protein [Pseudomonas putida]MCI0914666.1 hypothetical protein [Pseudomonas putida]